MVFNRNISAPSGQVNFQGTAQDTLLMNNALGGMQKVVTDQFAADDTKKAAALDAQNKLQVQAMKDASDKYTADIAMFGHKNVFDAAIYKVNADINSKKAEIDFKTNELISKAKSEEDIQKLKNEAEIIKAKYDYEKGIKVQAIETEGQKYGYNIDLQKSREKNEADYKRQGLVNAGLVDVKKIEQTNALTLKTLPEISSALKDIKPIEAVETSRLPKDVFGTIKNKFTTQNKFDSIGKANVRANWQTFIDNGIKSGSFVGKDTDTIEGMFIDYNNYVSTPGVNPAEGILWFNKLSQTPFGSPKQQYEKSQRQEETKKQNKLNLYNINQQLDDYFK